MLRRLLLGAAAAALIAYSIGLVLHSHRFPEPGQPGAHKRDIVLFTALTVGAALLHVAACVAAHGRPPRLRHVLLVAGGVRLLLLFGAPGPILEGDPARMRFDARLINQGVHPYEYKPAYLSDQEPADIPSTPANVERLIHARASMTAAADAPRPEQVVRPDLRTNATPLQLWIGALADRFKPQSTRGFAFAVLLADSLAMFFLVLALRRLCLPVGWLMVYAWSPVLLKECYASLSPDAFVLPALALLIYCISANLRILTAVPLAMCGGLRFALLTLVPASLRRLGVLGTTLTVVLLVVPFLPLHTPDVPMQRYVEGNLHVWRNYEYNSALENVLRGGLGQVATEAENTLVIGGVTMVEPGDAIHAFVAKVLCLLVLLAVTVYLMIRWGHAGEAGSAPESAIGDLFVMVVTLLLVSPVLRPCHALWLLPILVVRPSGIAWLALPGLTCLSYLTHLVGPDAADLTLLDGDLSFRVFEYGALLFLLFIDLLWRRRIFARYDELTGRKSARAQEQDQPGRPREPALTY